MGKSFTLDNIPQVIAKNRPTQCSLRLSKAAPRSSDIKNTTERTAESAESVMEGTTVGGRGGGGDVTRTWKVL